TSRSRSTGGRGMLPTCVTRMRPSLPCMPSAPDPDGHAQLSQHRDGGEVRELAGAGIVGGNVLDLDAEAAELPLDGDAVLVPRLARHGEDLDVRALGTDARERQGGDDVHVRGEGLDRTRRGALEDQRLARDRVEVDALLLDPWRAREAAGRLA